MVQDSVKGVPEFMEIVKKVKNIVTHFKKSVSYADALRLRQEQEEKRGNSILKLKQKFETRWSSMYSMLERFMDLSPHIGRILMDKSILDKAKTNNRAYQTGEKTNTRLNQAPEMISHAEVRVIQDGIDILAPVETVTTIMSGAKYISSSQIIPVLYCLKRNLVELLPSTAVSRELCDNVIKKIDQRFYGTHNIEKNHFFSIATLLDPRFKKTIPVDSALANSKAQEKICNEIKKIRDAEKRNERDCNNDIREDTTHMEQSTGINNKLNKLWSVHEKLKMQLSSRVEEAGGISIELRQFLNSTTIDENEDPLIAWSKYKNDYPNIYKIEMRYLVVPGTPVPSERLFSKAGNIIIEKRTRLKGKRALELIFLNSLDDKHW